MSTHTTPGAVDHASAAPGGARTLVAGVDSSTQSCKVVVRDAATGELVRSGSAKHPEGTEVHPDAWWDAFCEASAAAGGLTGDAGVAALGVGGQQHGMVLLDADGEVLRPALLWNDTRSASSAADLVAELGAEAWARATGSVLVASITATKLRWVADHEPELVDRIAAVALPHDWLTWRIAGYGPVSQDLEPDLAALVTDRSDASGTGYFDASGDDGRGAYRYDLLALALRVDESVARQIVLPRVLGPAQDGGHADPAHAGRVVDGTTVGAVLAPGAGDNAAAALALGMRAGDVTVSLGTSGVVSAVADRPSADASGLVNGFADATGRYLLLGVTLNASRVLDAACRMLGVDHDGLSRLALAAPAGADGLVLLPYLEGERTPNLPDATGSVHGLRLATATPEHLARAAVEGMLCGLADGLDALVRQGVDVQRVRLVGGAARSEAVRHVAPSVLGRPVEVPPAGEYVADGAARQAAWVLAGGDEPPSWGAASAGTVTFEAEPAPHVRHEYAHVRDAAFPSLRS
ncbi:xylulokinase [Luteimicrobium subarcticum]|uniref:Xylulose kinase n=1 Tax=Luteimicrobium subarcticum TaxID=620910 RepID=A0A2M8WS33_9MICO|nr:xylulokinase [Luteimicrobium subarcticum]PJI93751.1 xylulokinase [Luteimicrobium subarcticum]